MIDHEDPGGRLAKLANRLARAFKSTSRARWENFIDDECAVSREEEIEHDFYGDTYLPRKFKMGISHPEENCIDVFSQDVGLVPDCYLDGYHVLVGGGLGRSYANQGGNPES